MTSSDRSSGDRSRDEVLAGEYVLGVLSLDDRRKVEARIVLDADFAAMVPVSYTHLTLPTTPYV